jgi:hypothetical protein
MGNLKYIVTPKGISKPSMTSTEVMGKSEVCKLLNNLEKEVKQLKEEKAKIVKHLKLEIGYTESMCDRTDLNKATKFFWKTKGETLEDILGYVEDLGK